MRKLATITPLFVLLLGCTQFPALDGAVSETARDAEYPTLAPINALLAQSAPAGQQVTAATAQKDVNARAAALRARARRLRARVVDPATQQRMNDGVSQ